VAWGKLYAGRPMPFDVVSCGGVATLQEDRGGADMLRTMLRACCLHLERQAHGLFDHDREGMEQLNSLVISGQHNRAGQGDIAQSCRELSGLGDLIPNLSAADSSILAL
jgi:hypothetical protein